MARTEYNDISITYAGKDLIDGGMIADVDGSLNGSTQYSTQAVNKLGAARVELDETGNADGESSLTVAVDYTTEQAMLADIITRQAWCDGHKLGVLALAAGSGTGAVSLRYNAGLTAFSYTRSAGGHALRMVYAYSFIVGSAAE